MNVYRLGRKQLDIVNELKAINKELISCVNLKVHSEISTRFINKLDVLRHTIKDCAAFEFDFAFNNDNLAYIKVVKAVDKNKAIVKFIKLI